jgi:hypothetical protein
LERRSVSTRPSGTGRTSAESSATSSERRSAAGEAHQQQGAVAQRPQPGPARQLAQRVAQHLARGGGALPRRGAVLAADAGPDQAHRGVARVERVALQAVRLADGDQAQPQGGGAVGLRPVGEVEPDGLGGGRQRRQAAGVAPAVEVGPGVA